VDVVSVVGWGTMIWFVAFLVMLPLRGRLEHAGHPDWFWTSLAGWTLGLLGIAVARAQRAARQAAERAPARRRPAHPAHPGHPAHPAEPVAGHQATTLENSTRQRDDTGSG
jgi:hypothetical protein